VLDVLLVVLIIAFIIPTSNPLFIHDSVYL
jgi:hypothetical protein